MVVKTMKYHHNVTRADLVVTPFIWNKITNEIEQLIHSDNLPEGIEIAGKIGIGDPVVSSEFISFNGALPNNCGEFTFKREDHKTKYKFKTNLQSYDLIVCACLLSLKKHLKKNIEITNLGSYKNWEKAIEYYEFVTQEEAPVLFLEQEEKAFLSWSWKKGILKEDIQGVLQNVSIILDGYVDNLKIKNLK